MGLHQLFRNHDRRALPRRYRTDGRVAQEICRRLGIRSIAGALLRYERDVVELLEVFSPHTFAFDEGDLAILERLAQTALLMVSDAQLLKRT